MQQKSKILIIIVGVINILLTTTIIILSVIAWCNYKIAFQYFSVSSLNKDVIWFCFIIVPLFTIIGLVSSIQLIRYAVKDKGCYWSWLQYLLFILLEILFGFVFPSICFNDYQYKISLLLTVDKNFGIFYLLTINPATIIILIWQILSFWMVQCFPDHNNNNPLIHESSDLESQLQPPELPQNNACQEEHIEPDDTSNSNDNNNSDNLARLNSRQIKCIVSLETGNLSRATELPKDISSKFLKERRKCLAIGKLYEDVEFPASFASIGFHIRNIEWKRPFELVKNPRFFPDNVSRFDIVQGGIGNCWFIAGLVSLTLNKECFNRVVPEDNDWEINNNNNYCGMFHFRFWDSYDSRWEEVIIDDRLPTRDGKLFFLTSRNKNIFWGPLLEKGFAKFIGNYRCLSSNKVGRAFKNLTGGNLWKLRLDRHKSIPTDFLFNVMHTAMKRNHLLGCSIFRRTPDRTEEVIEPHGLVSGHAYSITNLVSLRLVNGARIPLVRLFNPWGCTGWSGTWSDSHPLWKFVDPKSRDELNLKFDDNGEFWFPLRELSTHFDLLDICWVSSEI